MLRIITGTIVLSLFATALSMFGVTFKYVMPTFAICLGLFLGVVFTQRQTHG